MAKNIVNILFLAVMFVLLVKQYLAFVIPMLMANIIDVGLQIRIPIILLLYKELLMMICAVIAYILGVL